MFFAFGKFLASYQEISCLLIVFIFVEFWLADKSELSERPDSETLKTFAAAPCAAWALMALWHASPAAVVVGAVILNSFSD